MDEYSQVSHEINTLKEQRDDRGLLLTDIKALEWLEGYKSVLLWRKKEEECQT